MACICAATKLYSACDCKSLSLRYHRRDRHLVAYTHLAKTRCAVAVIAGQIQCTAIIRAVNTQSTMR